MIINGIEILLECETVMTALGNKQGHQHTWGSSVQFKAQMWQRDLWD